MKINTHELAWAAGFFDGEGYTGQYFSQTCAFPKISISQVNKKNLERFQCAVLNVGKIYGPYIRKNRPNNRPGYYYGTRTLEEAQAVLAMLWKWLGKEKKTQARAAFVGIRFTGKYQSEKNKIALANSWRNNWNDPKKRKVILTRLAKARKKSIAVTKSKKASSDQLVCLERGRNNRWANVRAIKEAS